MVGGTPSLAVKFFYLDLTGLIMFCIFLWFAVKAARKRDIALHLRLITCTAIIPLEAVFERTFIYGTPTLVPNFDVALVASMITLFILCIGLIAAEWWYRRLRWPFTILFGYYLIMALTTDMIARTGWFNAFAVYYANI